MRLKIYKETSPGYTYAPWMADVVFDEKVYRRGSLEGVWDWGISATWSEALATGLQILGDAPEAQE